MIDKGTKWSLAPAYDLLNVNLANPIDNEELALPIEGKKKRLRKDHFERFGQGLDLNDKQIDVVFKRFIKNKAIAIEWIDNSFLSDKFKERYKEILEKRYLVLTK